MSLLSDRWFLNLPSGIPIECSELKINLKNSAGMNPGEKSRDILKNKNFSFPHLLNGNINIGIGERLLLQQGIMDDSIFEGKVWDKTSRNIQPLFAI